jgi:hypothetical protein
MLVYHCLEPRSPHKLGAHSERNTDRSWRSRVYHTHTSRYVVSLYQLARLSINDLDEDKANVYLDNVLSISHIETTGASCAFCGVDGADVVTKFPGHGAVNLGDEDDVGLLPPKRRSSLPFVHILSE